MGTFQGKGPHLNWKNFEKDICIEEALKILQTTPPPTGKRNLNNWHLRVLEQAAVSERFAPDRRKPHLTWALRITLKNRLTKALAALTPVHDAPAPTPSPDTPALILAVAEPEAPALALAQAPPEPPPRQPTFEESVGERVGSFVGMFMHELERSIGEAVYTNMSRALSEFRLEAQTDPSRMQSGNALTDTVPPKVNGNGHDKLALKPLDAIPAKLPAKLERPKIVVIGLHADSARKIEKNFPNMRFRFVDKHVPAEQIARVADDAALTVVMTAAVGHSVEQKIKGKLVRCDGMKTSLIRLLHKHFPAQIIPARHDIVDKHTAVRH